MLDPQSMWQAQAHRDDLLSEAAHDRLVSQATASQPGWGDRALLVAAKALVRSGLRMHAWYHARRFHRGWAEL